MSREYTPEEMLQWLKDHFDEMGYEVTRYSKEFLPARVPLYCVKKEGDRIVEQIVVEVTTDEDLSIGDFFPKLLIRNVEIPEARPVRIPGASPVRFDRHYFPKAKIFFAYPDYAKETSGFTEFKEFCEEKGIGLLKTSEAEIEEVVAPCSLFDEICNLLFTAGGSRTDIEDIMGDHLENCLHYLVYYPQPIYTRRAIIGREEDVKGIISMRLIDKQRELKNIIYRKELKDLASEYRELAPKYRQEAHSDYDIAEKYTHELWEKYLGLEYPDIHRRVENILQRNEKYREHFVHQFQVFLLGTYILDIFYTSVSKKFLEKHGCEIEKAWLAASAFHDFNYGLQNFNEWLGEFFRDTLRITDSQTKESLNLLNLDAAVIRDALYEKIVKITEHLIDGQENDSEVDLIKFFYEKMVIDRNHGVLSAVSLLKLYDEKQGQDLEISEKGILEAATAIASHDEDIWESLCGCQGYRRSPGSPHQKDGRCVQKCNREVFLGASKKSRIFDPADPTKKSCEAWENKLMRRRVMDKIRFKDNPILFLLIFCDSAQDEGRITGAMPDKDISSLTDVVRGKSARETTIDIKLKSDGDDIVKKESEIERVAWCLKDARFRISINDTTKKMNGSGGE